MSNQKEQPVHQNVQDEKENIPERLPCMEQQLESELIRLLQKSSELAQIVISQYQEMQVKVRNLMNDLEEIGITEIFRA
ncbi:unnamed protein product [Blepharisma stoltei]|uniref:Uncharacterized protein n=1 Tax=Blepharisma stoltei TaxID=1481888 RepID=A0AAU9IWE9_9CILI|nr:unnamed protein product [Blepharisma stoltei]